MTTNRIRRTALVGIAGSLVAALSLTACGGSEGSASGTQDADDSIAPAEGGGEARTLRFTNFEPENIAGEQTKAFGEAVEAASNGELTFEYFWGGSLLPGPEAPNGIASGVADLGLMLAAYNPDVFKIGNWAGALMSLPVAEHPTGILQASEAHAKVALSDEAAVKEFEDQGLKILAPVVPYAHFDILCVDPVTDLASAEGKRVRVAGEVWAKEAAAVGMQPVNLAPGEVYEALQRGVIDCVMHHPPGYVGNSTWEIASHYTPLSFSGAYAYLVMSKATWDALSAEQQAAIWDGAEAYFEQFEKKSLNDYATWGSTASSEHDIEFHAPSQDIVDALTAHQAQARQDMVSTPPDTLSDPAAYVAAYESAMEEALPNAEAASSGAIDMSDPMTAFVNGGDTDLAGWMDQVRSVAFESARGGN